MNAAPHILLADDHPLYLEALSGALGRHLPDALLDTADDYLQLSELLARHGEEVDLLVMDLQMPGGAGYGGLYFLRQSHPELPILVISASDDLGTRSRCLEAGASGFLSKSSRVEPLIDTIHQIIDGRYKYPATPRNAASAYTRLGELTPAQFRVLHLLAAGLSNKQIARRLEIAEKTVKIHVSAILQKLGVDNRVQAALLLSDDGPGRLREQTSRAGPA